MGLLDFLSPRKKAEQQLIRRINQATNAVKLGLYFRLVLRYRELHHVEFAKSLAAAVTNETLSHPPSNEQGREFVDRNRSLIEQELFALGNDMEIRRVLTETIRARALIPFVHGHPAETWLDPIEKLQHFGILIPGGNTPSPETFFPMATQFYDTRPE
jgi:hypothetical protein